MKLNKIISTALVMVMLFSAMIAVMPTNVDAAHISSSTTIGVPDGYTEAFLTNEEVKAYLESTLLYDYDDPMELLTVELEQGLLYQFNSPNALYSAYINKYSGMLYYVNNVTGQVLTSNPTNVGYLENGSVVLSGDIAEQLSSQI